MKQVTIIFSLLSLFVSMQSWAEVLGSDKHGFIIKLVQQVKTTPEKAYQQFIHIGQWWHSDHTWFGDATKLSLTPKVGSCFCEINGDKQALHMTVSYVEPNKEIRLIGGLGPLQMLGVHGGMSWSFTPLDNYHTEIILHYQVSGFTEQGLDKLAPIVDKVQSLQFNRLLNKLQTL
ncbi:ATPase [Thalassotalea insulae]|uniref:ATPase n=1 Tax=Thalassotalea insulae TaxID=2056778 RepID=A0ABQ6GSE3_9GAMM|nr:hypothetical protein [Thalassotalea insulae]GLX77061.1 ATPase [Thalassotalea insulae]